MRFFADVVGEETHGASVDVDPRPGVGSIDCGLSRYPPLSVVQATYTSNQHVPAELVASHATRRSQRGIAASNARFALAKGLLRNVAGEVSHA